jgi:N-acetylneuraminate lyase
VKLIAQVGSMNVKESVELAKYCTELGYDSLSAVTPFYYKFSFEEIKEYYETILRDVDNRMIIYSIPFLTGTNISEVQFGELFKNEKIIGVKFTAADFFLLERIRKAFPDKLIFAGFDEMLLPATVLGVDGAIGSTYNINGLRAREIYELAREGKIEEARKVQHVTNDLITELLESGIYPTLKAVLEEMGVSIGYNRRPMASANEKQKIVAKNIFAKYFS